MRQHESPFKIFHFQFLNLLKCWVFLLIKLYLGIWAHLICCWLDPLFIYFFSSIGGTANLFFWGGGGWIVAVRSKILSFLFFQQTILKNCKVSTMKASLSPHPNFLLWLRLIIIVSYRNPFFFYKLFHIGALCSYNIDILIFSFWSVFF